MQEMPVDEIVGRYNLCSERIDKIRSNLSKSDAKAIMAGTRLVALKQRYMDGRRTISNAYAYEVDLEDTIQQIEATGIECRE